LYFLWRERNQSLLYIDICSLLAPQTLNFREELEEEKQFNNKIPVDKEK
jgi:hypothetical protein